MEFGPVLAAHLERAGLSQRAFARRVGYSHVLVSYVITGRRTPPLEAIESWADELGVTGAERTRFIQLAWLAHAPPQVRDLVARQQAQIERLRRKQGRTAAEGGGGYSAKRTGAKRTGAKAKKARKARRK